MASYQQVAERLPRVVGQYRMALLRQRAATVLAFIAGVCLGYAALWHPALIFAAAAGAWCLAEGGKCSDAVNQAEAIAFPPESTEHPHTDVSL